MMNNGRASHLVLRWLPVVCAMVLPACSGAPAAPGGQVTGILGAFGAETRQIESRLTDRRVQTVCGLKFITGRLGDRAVVLAETGIGKVNAAMTTTLLIDHYRPREVVFSGIAGGISDRVRPGDIVIAEKTVQHDLGSLTRGVMKREPVRDPVTGMENPLFFPADGSLLRQAQAAAGRVRFQELGTSVGPRRPAVITGVVSTGDIFVACSDKKKELLAELKADAVEMEGAAVAQVCYQMNTPCVVIRSISDLADESAAVDLEKFYRAAAANSAALVMEVVRSLPGKP
jgi:adenosylhomocysteine nucleosidase